MSVRFAIVGTMRLGALARPEPLDDDGQAAAFWRLRMDESQELRARFELGMSDARVLWNRVPEVA